MLLCVSFHRVGAILHVTNTSRALIRCVSDTVLMQKWGLGTPGVAYAVGTHPLPDGLLATPSQCQVDAIQRHPVDLLLPAGPVPPHEGVTLCAHILVIAVPAGGGTSWDVCLGARRMSSTREGPSFWKSSEGGLTPYLGAGFQMWPVHCFTPGSTPGGPKTQVLSF